MLEVNLTTRQNFFKQLRRVAARDNALREIVLHYLYIHQDVLIRLSAEVLREGMPPLSPKLHHLKQQIKRWEPSATVWQNPKLIAIFATLQNPPTSPPSEFLGVLHRVRQLTPGETFSFAYDESPGYFINPYQLKSRSHRSLTFQQQGNYMYVTRN